MPDDLLAWVGAQRRRFEVDPSVPPEPLVVQRRGVRLSIRFVPSTPMTGPSLVIRHAASGLSPDGARRLGVSPREAEVLRLLASGASSATIADALVVSRHTVHRHLQNQYAKLGVRSRTAAVAKAREADVPRRAARRRCRAGVTRSSTDSEPRSSRERRCSTSTVARSREQRAGYRRRSTGTSSASKRTSAPRAASASRR